MPSKKRDVHAFVTRLNPLLVRKLDAYALQSNLSRNQAVEKLLERCFVLTREVSTLREFEKSFEQESQTSDIGQYFEEQDELIEIQRMTAAEKSAKRNLVQSADDVEPPITDLNKKRERDVDASSKKHSVVKAKK